MFNIQLIRRNGLAAETSLWLSRILSIGGSANPNSVIIANNFIKKLRRKSYYQKIKYLLPLLGNGINAARVPLIDIFNVGPANNTSFTNSDFNENTGLQGDGSTKLFNLIIQPGQLGTNIGGLGYWENNISFSGNDSVPIGMYCSNTLIRVQIDMRSASSRYNGFGLNTNAAINLSAPSNGNFYGQSTSNSNRILYYNASQTAINTTSDTSSIDATPICLMGTNTNSIGFWAGRCAVAYLTDGTLTTTEISDLDGLLRAYLLGPAGKPQ